MPGKFVSKANAWYKFLCESAAAIWYLSKILFQSRSSSLRSLLRKLDELSDSREFCYKLAFAWF